MMRIVRQPADILASTNSGRLFHDREWISTPFAAGKLLTIMKSGGSRRGSATSVDGDGGGGG
jgi:hypothetical protein